MKDDPIVQEARDAGRAYFARFKGDLKAAFEDLARQTEELRRAGREVVTLRPRRPSIRAAKKATIAASKPLALRISTWR